MHQVFLKKRQGVTLVEIVVAMAISIITITSSAVFSSSLVQRAQNLYLETSALQLQNLMLEQVRLLERGLGRDVSEGRDYNGGFQDSELYLTKNLWNQFCTTKQDTDEYFIIVLPQFTSGDPVSAEISQLTDMSKSSGDRSNPVSFKQFTPISNAGDFGGLSNTSLEATIRKTLIKPSSSAVDFGDYFSLNIMIRYKYGSNPAFKYTKPLETKIIKKVVCP